MIIGTCPYDDCTESLMIPIADHGAFEKHECEGCQRVIWTRHSRLDPWSMTEGDFLASHTVDDETKTIQPRETEGGA